MTTRIALILFLTVLTAIGLDLAAGWGGTLFTLKKGVALIEWIRFWD